MVLAIDIGNTNITMGIFLGDEIIARFRMTTTVARTSDEYGVLMSEMIRLKDIDRAAIEAVIISSVVPKGMYSMNNAILKYFGMKPLVVGPGVKSGIKLASENPKEIGADRIVDAVAAYEIYGGPVIIIDFGTATTYDLILEDGSFTAGITAPGIKISAKALWEETAKLPEIEIEKPGSILAKNTITSMQAGLVYGQIGQTEYIIKKIIEETGLKDIKTVATGGLGKMIADATDYISEYDPDLTLKGLNIVWSKNANRKC